MNLRNQLKGLCIICDRPIPPEFKQYLLCNKCGKVCGVDPSTVGKELAVYDAKSDCCHADFTTNLKNTCSNECLEKSVTEFESIFGKDKLVIHDGKAYKVPVRHIILHGLKADELEKYPRAE